MTQAHTPHSQILILTIVIVLLAALATLLWIRPAFNNNANKQPTTSQGVTIGSDAPNQPDNHGATVYE